jgi:hypothetical protein
LRSCIGKIGGSKSVPLPLPLGFGYAVQEDNVAIEFNIPPAQDAREFIKSIQDTLNLLGSTISEQYGLSIVQISAASFPPEELLHPDALVFGCDPDYNAWTGERNPKPVATDPALRSCGGHIHIGYDKSVYRPDDVIKSVDLHVGVPSVLMDDGQKRKELYGKRGAYREKSYGVEYRTLSNFWIFKESLINWAWENTVRAVDAVGVQLNNINNDAELIEQAIDGNNKEIAQMLVNKYNLGVVYA